VLWDGHNVWDTLGKHSLGYSFLALASAGLLVSAHTRPQTSWWPRVFSAPWLQSVGRYSYCLYLIHLPVMWTMKYLVFDPTRAAPVLGSAMPAQAVFWVVAFAPAFGLAWLSWRYFEAPILRLKRFFPY
jgi:peptidoglycan/LPS O-acetylase OafA/YrhL